MFKMPYKGQLLKPKGMKCAWPKTLNPNNYYKIVKPLQIHGKETKSLLLADVALSLAGTYVSSHAGLKSGAHTCADGTGVS